jgi:putative drug exporter of the RND superfamily
VEHLTRTVLRFRWPVLIGWILIFLVSVVLSQRLSSLLTNRFSLPGTDSARAEDILQKHFGQRTDGSFTLVVRTAPNGARQLLPQVRRAAVRGARVLPTGNVAAVSVLSPSLVGATITSKLEPADAKGYTDDIRHAVGTIHGATTYVSGQAAIEHDLDPVFARDLRVGELEIAIPIALLILVFVFGTLAFLVPFLFAAAAIPATLAIIWVFANFMELSTYLQNLVMLIGLGISVDYSLLIVYRYREEHRAGTPREEAVVRTMQTAGRAVVFSGTAVAIGLALMLFMPLPFLRGFGLGGLIIPAVSVICALTLLPVLLYWLAAPLDRVRLIPKRIAARRDAEQNFWRRLGTWIMRRPVAVAVVTAAVLLACAAPVYALEVGPGSNKGIPQNLEGVKGLNVIAAQIGQGALAPTAIVVDTGRAGGGRSPEVAAAVGRLETLLRRDPEVTRVTFDPRSPDAVDPTGRYLNIQVVGKHEYGTPPALHFVGRLRGTIVPEARFPGGVSVYAGGGPPGGHDFLKLTYGAFPWLVLAVLLLTYFLLLRAFRSVVLPLKAIVLNCLSIGASYGLLTVFFRWGLGNHVGLISFDQIEGWIPVFIFAMVFGLSMDYEVFLVSRMREEWDHGASNENAIVEGLAKTGRIVTAAGIVMFAAFMGFVAGSIVGLQQFGLGLALAIVLDVTVVRALLVPSVMKLFDRWNWWLPEGIAKVFRVKPSPLRRRVPAPEPT